MAAVYRPWVKILTAEEAKRGVPIGGTNSARLARQPKVPP